MRLPNDTALAGLAEKLSATQFTSPINPIFLTSENTAALQARYTQNKLSGVNILFGRGKTTVFVRLYVGGQHRTFGVFGNDYLTAARVADVLTLRIGAFRLRSQRTVPDSEFNYSRVQAQTDWDTEPAIAGLVLAMEKHLRTIGALFDPAATTLPALPKVTTEALLTQIAATLLRIEAMLAPR